MAIRAVYTDLDGTLLGKGASLFRDGDGAFTLLAARALEACHRAGAEVVIKSGRRRAQVMEDARLLGLRPQVQEGARSREREARQRAQPEAPKAWRLSRRQSCNSTALLP